MQEKVEIRIVEILKADFCMVTIKKEFEEACRGFYQYPVTIYTLVFANVVHMNFQRTYCTGLFSQGM